MRLFHERSYPRSAPLSKSDEEECFTPSGRLRGVWLTTEVRSGPDVVSLDATEALVAPYEVTKAGAEARTFVVPYRVLVDVGSRVGG